MINKKACYFWFVALWISIQGGFAQTDTTFTLKEFSPRNGLPYFFQKVKKSKPVKIAYLGGSITRKDSGWRDQTFTLLKQAYPKVEMQQIMAAIGGTGSDFGMFRVQEHVLKHNPDLVFVEFAVNDNGKRFREVMESMESIVRQIWTHNIQTDICFIYTLSKGNIDWYKTNQFSVAASAMEKVADHYKIPSINVGMSPAQLILEDKMFLEEKTGIPVDKQVFATDGVHPLIETGHKLYAERVIMCMQTMARSRSSSKHILPRPLDANSVRPVTMIQVSDPKLERSSGWTATDSVSSGKEFVTFTPIIITTSDSAAFLRIKFTGQTLCITDIMGPSSGQLLVQIDDEPVRSINRFDAFSTYYRLNYSIIKAKEHKEHIVTIRNSPIKLDKLKILRARQEMDQLSGKYLKQQPFIANIFFR